MHPDSSESDPEDRSSEYYGQSISHVNRGRSRSKKWPMSNDKPPQRKSGCYICGGNHFWRYCENKCCPAWGHSLRNCSRKKSQEPKNRIMEVARRCRTSELSVILPVKLANIPLEMILDSGAGPSVIDLSTVQELCLEQRIHRRAGTVYGVGENPVHLLGNITFEVDLGDDQLVQHSFGMLQEVAYTLNTLPAAGTQLSPYHIMHGVEPISNPSHRREGVLPQMTPKCWYDEASQAVEVATGLARENLQSYRNSMK